MSTEEAIAYIRSCAESDGPETYDDAAELFEAIFGRAPDPDDGTAFMLWNQCCAAVGV